MTPGILDNTLTVVFGENAEIARHTELQIAVSASAVLAIGSTLLSPLISDLAAVFGVSESGAGLLIVVYLVTVTACLPLSGFFSDRVGRRLLLASGLAVFGIAGALLAIAPSFEVALGFRTIQAVGFAAALPATIAIFGDLYDRDREAMGQGMRQSGINIAIMTVPLLSSLLFILSWRAPFLIYLAAVPIAVWSWRELPPVTPSRSSSNQYASELVQLCRKPVIAAVLTSFVVRFFVLYGFFTYVSVLLVRDLGANVVLAGTVVSLKAVASLVTSTQAGRYASWADPAIVMICGFVLTGVGIMLMGSVSIVAAVIIGSLLFGLGDGIIGPVQKSLLNQLSPEELRGGTISMATVLQNGGKIIGPIGFATAFSVLPVSTTFLVFGALNGVLGVLLFGFVFGSNWYRIEHREQRRVGTGND